jgi:hypothetical protein
MCISFEREPFGCSGLVERSGNQSLDLLELFLGDLAFCQPSFGDLQGRLVLVVPSGVSIKEAWQVSVSSEADPRKDEDAHQHDEHHQERKNPEAAHPEAVPRSRHVLLPRKRLFRRDERPLRAR